MEQPAVQEGEPNEDYVDDGEPIDLNINMTSDEDEDQQDTSQQSPTKESALNESKRFLQEKLNKCDTILAMLNSTQESIIKTSGYFMKLGKLNSDFVGHLIQKISLNMQTASNDRKLKFIFLTNDLIQKSKLEEIKELSEGKEESHKGWPIYWREFQTVIEIVLPIILKGYSEEELKIKLDIIRVLLVWQERGVYSEDFIQGVFKEGAVTPEEIQIVQAQREEARLVRKKEEQLKKDENFSRKIFGTSKLKLSHFSGMSNDPVNPQWLKLADQLLLIQENEAKLEKVEDQLDKMVEDQEKCDEIDLECKIDELRKLQNIQKGEVREILQFANDSYNKIENQILQLLLLQDRVDETLLKVDKLKQN